MKTIILVTLTILALLLAVFFTTPTVESYKKEEIIEVKPPIKLYAENAVFNEFGADQWKYFHDLIMRESTWRPYADNPRSTAYGLGQFLDSTWDDVGCVKTSDPYTQIDCTIKYQRRSV